MAKKTVIQVRDTEIKSIRQDDVDFICLTDIAKLKNDIDPNGVIANWMRNRNTIEFLGIWETLYNPNFNPSNSRGLERKQDSLKQTIWILNIFKTFVDN